MNYANSKGTNFTGHLITGKNAQGVLPYILVIPENLQDGKELVVESLNFEGTNIVHNIVPHAINQLKVILEMIEESPVLIPFTPDVRGGIPYYQQLSRECFEQAPNGEYNIDFPRVDLQIINTINDAKNKIMQETGKSVEDKIFLNGYSSSGVFAREICINTS